MMMMMMMMRLIIIVSGDNRCPVCLNYFSLIDHDERRHPIFRRLYLGPQLRYKPSAASTSPRTRRHRPMTSNPLSPSRFASLQTKSYRSITDRKANVVMLPPHHILHR
jgi:hypothetical protein